MDVYSVQLVLRLTGADPGRLRDAVATLLARHRTLRVTFAHDTAGRPWQLVPEGVDVDWRTVETGGDRGEIDALIDRVADEDRARRFDLARGPLTRFSAVVSAPPERRGAGETCVDLIVTAHHIVIDGWSLPILAAELLAAYGGAELAPPPPYERHLRWLAGRDRDAARRAWAGALAGLDGPTLLVAADPDRTPVLSDRHHLHLDAELTGALVEAARRHGVTLSTVFEAAWAVVLARVTGRTDVVFGATVSGRPAEVPDVSSMVGFFINTVPVRATLRAGEEPGDLLRRLQAERSALLDHDHLGLADIQAQVGVGPAATRGSGDSPAPRRSGDSPAPRRSGGELFDTLVVFQNVPEPGAPRHAGAGLRIEGFRHRDATHYPLTIAVEPPAPGGGAGIRIILEHRPDVLDAVAVARLAERYETVLRALAVDDHTVTVPVGRLDVLGEPERARLRSLAGADTGAGPDGPVPTTIPTLLAAQVDRHRDTAAIVAGDDRLTYGELAARSRRLARALIRRGAGPERIVALRLGREASTVVAILAVLEAGAAYLPLDPCDPPARLDAVVAAARPVLVVDAAELAVLEAQAADLAATPLTDAERASPLRPAHPAWVIFTSGSTGEPKGVVVPHAGVGPLLANHRRTLLAPATAARGRRLRIAHAWPFAFDASWQPLLGLLDGHELHLVDDDHRVDPDRLVTLLAERGIDMIEVTPSFLGQLVAAGLLTAGAGGACPLALLGVGGEAVPANQWAELGALAGTEAWNFYGPTECTVDTVTARIAEHDRPVIGRPVDGTRASVLDGHLQPVPPPDPASAGPQGATGELYLGGPQLARGYLGRPERTAERFVADPFGPPGSRLYRTGDLVRWTAGGQIEFVRRADDQVKVRGFRIEPAEVEAALGARPEVAQAAVVAVAGRLVAYVVAAPGVDPDARALRAAAAATLPAHLVPAAVVPLAELPMTATAKLDRTALPAPDWSVMVGTTPPRTPAEAAVVELMAAVLDLPTVGADDDFIDLGGDSLAAMRLARLAAEHGLALTPRQVLRLRTPAALAAAAG